MSYTFLFESFQDVYYDDLEGDPAINSTPHGRISEAARSLLESSMSEEIEFYSFARQRLRRQSRDFGVRPKKRNFLRDSLEEDEGDNLTGPQRL